MYGYNNPYLQNYQQNFNQGQPSFNQQSTQDERIWVQNESSAENFLLIPNSFVRLWSATENKFYEKRTDATGRPLPMDIYEYKRISPQIATPTEEVDKISIDDINARFEAITSRIDALEKVKKVVKNAKQPDADDTSV